MTSTLAKTEETPPITFPPVAPRKPVLTPVSPGLQRATGGTPFTTNRTRHQAAHYVALPGEEAAALRAAENFLVEFCGADFSAMQWNLRPATVRAAQSHLLVVYLGNPNVADIFLDHIADAAGLTKSELRRQIRDRADFANHSLAIIESNRAGALREIESWLNH